MEQISVIVLAGGASQRMGTNKALLPIGEQETLIGRVLANLRTLTDDLILVSNAPELYSDLDVRHASDRFQDAGPLAGLHAGLLAARRRWSFVAACDMPLIDHRLARYMVLLTEGYDVVTPKVGDAIEPLHTLYSQACLPAIESHLQAGQRRMISFFPKVRVRYIAEREIAIFDREGRTFANANTSEDWERLKALIANTPL